MKSKVLISLCGLLMISACSQEIPQNKAKPVDWIKVGKSQQNYVRVFPGVVESIERVTVGFDIGGRIVEINVDTGDRFSKGDVLAKLDDESQRLLIDELDANIMSAKAAFKEANAKLIRATSLAEQQAISQAEYDAAVRAQVSSGADIKRLDAQKKSAEKTLKDTHIFAPYNGQVINKTANLAQTVNANQEILEIQTDSELREVTISVPESLINLFSQGMSAQIEFSALSSTAVSGKVVRIGKQALGMAAFPVTILLSDVPEALVNGMTASVSIDFRITNNALTLTIPRSSLVPDNNNEYYVFVVDEEANHVRKRSVNLEKLSNEFALVNSGVSAGEIIIAKGAIFLSEGQSISLLSQDIRNFPE